MPFPVTILVALVGASISLPGGPPVGMDYLAYDRANDRIWVPAGNTGSVDVVDVATGKVTTIGGLPTAPPPRHGRPRMGPSSATVADGVVWIGNRGDNKLRAFDARSLAPRGSVQLDAMPDGLAYVVRAHEVWATVPADQSIKIVSVAGAAPAAVAKIKLDGAPEGYAVDDAKGVFYTNLEDKDRTLAIDVATRKVVSNWPAGCGTEGPRGLALDAARRLLFVACTDGARVFDLAHDGKPVGSVKTGGGVDNVDYDAQRRRLFVASREDGTLTIARVTDAGALEVEATVPTVKGARNPITDASGTVYLEDSAGGHLLVVDPEAALRAAHEGAAAKAAAHPATKKAAPPSPDERKR